MSDLSTALAGLRQAEKQLQWVKYAQEIINAAQSAEMLRDAAILALDKLKDEHATLTEKHDKLLASVLDLHKKEEEAARKAETEEKHLSLIEAEVLAEVTRANEIAKSLHDEFIAKLNDDLSVKQDEHDAHVLKLEETIGLLEEKKHAIEADIADLSKKWS